MRSSPKWPAMTLNSQPQGPWSRTHRRRSAASWWYGSEQGNVKRPNRSSANQKGLAITHLTAQVGGPGPRRCLLLGQAVSHLLPLLYPCLGHDLAFLDTSPLASSSESKAKSQTMSAALVYAIAGWFTRVKGQRLVTSSSLTTCLRLLRTSSLSFINGSKTKH